MNRKLKQKNDGFTIIEVLIVLAIAGLIMLVVFMAVPALQRNSRNTQRKSDVSSLLGGMAEHSANNAGGFATQAQLDALVETSYYTGAGTSAGQFQVSAATSTATGLATNQANDRVRIFTGATCNASNQAIQGPARAIVAVYLTETGGGGYQLSCQES